MAKHVNQWRPDTCGCVLEYEWDDAEPPETRAHTPTRTVFDCGCHGAPADHHAHHGRVLGENLHKNAVVNALSEGLDERLEFAFNDKRELQIKAPAGKRTAMLARLMAIAPGRKVHVV